MFVGQTPPEVSFEEDLSVVHVKCAVKHFGRVLDFHPVVLVLTVAERDVVENRSFQLGDLFFEKRKVNKRFFELLRCFEVNLVGFTVLA